MKILIISGEVSGDMQAAGLIQSFKKINPGSSIFAVGGESSRKAGAELIADIKDLSVMGFVEVLLKLKKIRKIFKIVSDWIETNKPDAVILVDFPSFNFKIARLLNKLKIPAIYFIPPKIWASRYKRIEFIRKYIKFVIVIFPFERNIYEKEGIKSYYLGNPLYQRYESGPARGFSGLAGNQEIKGKPVIAFLPGSRKAELKYHSRRVAGSMKAIKSIYKDAFFIIPFRKGIDNSYFLSVINEERIPPDWFKITESVEYAFNASDLIIVASGTASLEAAFFNKPMIIVYYLNYITYIMAKIIVKIDRIGLINILGGKDIVPELIETEFNPANVAKWAGNIFEDDLYSSNMVKEISNTVSSLKTEGNVFDEAAKLVYGKITHGFN